MNLSHWYNEEETRARLGDISASTLARMVKEKGRPEKRKRPRVGKKPESVYNPEDVDQLSAVSAVVVSDARTPAGGTVLVPMRSSDPEIPIGLQLAMQLVDKLATIAQQPRQNGVESSERLYLTIDQAADASGLSKALLRRLCHQKIGFGFRDGQIWKISRAMLERAGELAL